MTEYLTANHDAVLEVLHRLNFTNISHNKTKKEVRFSREEGRNPSAVVLNLQTLGFTCFSTNEKGNLYTLVMNKKMLRFPKALEWVANVTGVEKSRLNIKTRMPFGGFYKGLIREIQEPEYSMQTYDDEILEPYRYKYNTRFLHDGISLETQKEFDIGYDLQSMRITVPIWTLDGELCGIMGRSNDDECEKEYRWLPIIPCSRSLTLSAYHRNYNRIQQKGMCIVGESDKFPMQLHSFGCSIGLGTSGCHISKTQAKHIKSLLVPKVIVAFDEGLEEEQLIEETKKLVIDNHIFHNHVGYIWDENNDILKKGEKQSPSDLGKEAFMELVKRKVRWIQ